MPLQVQQEQLPIHLPGRRGSGFALWLAARELNLLAVHGYVLKSCYKLVKFWKSTILCLGPSLISVEINTNKSNGFSLELSTDPVILAETALKGLFHIVPVPCFTSQMSWKLFSASTYRGWLHFAWKSFLHFPSVGWGPESCRLMKHWANGQTFQQFFWISLRRFFLIFGSFGLMREMRETWHDQQPHVMIAWDMKEVKQLGW